MAGRILSLKAGSAFVFQLLDNKQRIISKPRSPDTPEQLADTVQFYLKQVKSHVPSEIFPFSILILITDSFKRTFKKIPWAENGQK